MTESIKFQDVIGQTQSVDILKLFVLKNKISRTLLFSGPEGIGKINAALAFAALCNCEKILKNSKKNNLKKQIMEFDSCGICASCKMVASKQHPDILHIGFKKTSITVSDIRFLLSINSMKPYMSKQKFVIVHNAQNMNIQASNAFLKFLEEPYIGTIVILISPYQNNLIPTVVSRCQQIRFKPINSKIIKKIILQRGIETKLANVIASLSQGSMTKAKYLSNNLDWDKKRKWLITSINLLYYNKGVERINDQFWILFAEVISDKETINESLAIIQCWLRDILIYKLTSVLKEVANIDMQEELDAASKQVSIDTILYQISIIQETQINLNSGANLRLAIDAMMIQMSNILD